MNLTLLLAGIAMIALLAAYVPTVYIRKTNRIIALLEKIEANTKAASGAKSTAV
jgi:hypothetical protein